VIAGGAVVVRWSRPGLELSLAANLSGVPVSGFPEASGRVLWREGEPGGADGHFAPWSVRWCLQDQGAVT